LQADVARSAVDAALPGLAEPLAHAGLLDLAAGRVRALLDCRPYAEEERDLWVVSDLTPGMDGAANVMTGDYVLGISPASTSLAHLTMRRPVARALDLGTGCGVQALHLAAHSDVVVATDVNPRALAMTRFNCALNEVAQVDVRDGSLFEPVAGERFDLIATNPPFVISPANTERLVYRDSGLPGDTVVERIVREAPEHLVDGGWLQVLANWVISKDTPWQERLAEWLRPGDDALVVQREVLDPAAYVELWLKDSGHHGGPDYLARHDAWLRWLDDQRVEGIGFGWINVRTAGSGARELLEWPYEVEQPIAPAIAKWGDAVARMAGLDEQGLLNAHPVVRPDVRQESHGQPGAEDPETIVLRQQRGLCRARQVDTVEAALVGASDGDLSVARLLDALASLLERDPAELTAHYLPVVAELVGEGFLELG
jgi:hypothetical protein